MTTIGHFYGEREERWRRLDELLGVFDARVKLTGGQADELYRLYRLAAGDLAYLQARTGNPALMEYLEDLVARAHFRLTPSTRTGLFTRTWRILRHDFPAVVRKEYRLVVLSLIVMLAGAAFGATAIVAWPESAEAILADFPNLLEQSPSEDAATRTGTDITMHDYLAFSFTLFVNNLRVSFLVFALGFTFGLGTLVVLFLNGAILGAAGIMYYLDGAGLFFLTWVGPHGSLELPAIILAGAAGLLAARTQLNAGGSLWRALAARKHEFIAILAGAGALLAVAGAIEGGFSQINTPGLALYKILVACVCFLAMIAWLFLLPVTPSGDSL